MTFVDEDEDKDAVEGSDLVTIPRFVAPFLTAEAAVKISVGHRLLHPIVVNNRVQVICDLLTSQMSLLHLNRFLWTLRRSITISLYTNHKRFTVANTSQ